MKLSRRKFLKKIGLLFAGFGLFDLFGFFKHIFGNSPLDSILKGFTEKSSFQEPQDFSILQYNKAVFKTTHNSYSIPLSLEDQLNSDIYGLELDMHLDLRDTNKKGLFKVGHSNIGNQLYQQESNPQDAYLSSWLACIADWSLNNSNHIPITVFIDLKDDLVNNQNYCSDLNSYVKECFKYCSLYTPRNYEEHEQIWPTIEKLRGKIILVLTGSENGYSQTKANYLNLDLEKRVMFTSFNEKDNNTDYSEKIKTSSPFVNLGPDWTIDKAQKEYDKGKVVRIFPYNEKQMQIQNYYCNFPATDSPVGITLSFFPTQRYDSSFNFIQK
ncbi:hypothetical protein GF327_06930 [Candidatus Woesearchaeota archaeon]|nr:hypothetical protein [Candidatus Woesearchaeota archaeon]